MIEVAIKNFVEYQFSRPPIYGIQRLRLTPKENERQRVISWDIILKGAKKETPKEKNARKKMVVMKKIR